MSAFSKSSIVKFEFSENVKDGFPLMIDDTTLAFHLSIRAKTLWYLIKMRNSKKAYRCFAIPQFNEDGSLKKMREIQEPMPHLKTVHSILNNMFSRMKMDSTISAYVKGKSCVDAAKRHVRASYSSSGPEAISLVQSNELESDPRYLKANRLIKAHDPESGREDYYHQPICMIKMDLKNYFPSIKASWIREFFQNEVGYSHYVSSLLGTLCSVRRQVKTKDKGMVDIRHLPQGSPLSGSLSNLIGFYRFGDAIKKMLAAHSSDWVMTVYSDDIVLTHPSLTLSDDEATMIVKKMRKIILAAGFLVNEKKTLIRRSDRGAHNKIKILGCIVTDQLNVPKSFRRKVTETISKCSEYGFESQCSKNQTVQGLVARIRGSIEYVRSIKPSVADTMTEKLELALQVNDVEILPDTMEGILK